ncbi:hypothetical protein [Methylobacterium sp. Leaf85]|nr:hypothetical protein [Methylobacterium sp. Leaf85]
MPPPRADMAGAVPVDKERLHRDGAGWAVVSGADAVGLRPGR